MRRKRRNVPVIDDRVDEITDVELYTAKQNWVLMCMKKDAKNVR